MGNRQCGRGVRAMERQLTREAEELRGREIPIQPHDDEPKKGLVLGGAEAGKSTLAKAAALLHGEGFFDEKTRASRIATVCGPTSSRRCSSSFSEPNNSGSSMTPRIFGMKLALWNG